MSWGPTWLPVKYAVAYIVVYFSVRQVASSEVAAALGFASFPLVWWVARRWGDAQAEAELSALDQGAAAGGSQFSQIVSRMFSFGHKPLPPLHDPPESKDQ